MVASDKFVNKLGMLRAVVVGKSLARKSFADIFQHSKSVCSLFKVPSWSRNEALKQGQYHFGYVHEGEGRLHTLTTIVAANAIITWKGS